ncbi:MAG TPA: cytochrome c oxidase assembly protein [Devosiaceae bacterium]
MAHAAHFDTRRQDRNLRVVLICGAVVLGMVGLSYAAVPLYKIFCQVTGYAGTTQVASSNVKGVIAREMGVRFDATVSTGLPIVVKAPEETFDRIGTVQTVTFKATNVSARKITTTASFNVTPDLTGLYFNKIQCFCFTQQTLEPGQTVDMPVTFFVDPDLDKDKNLRTVRELTLSYTFYASDNGGS